MSFDWLFSLSPFWKAIFMALGAYTIWTIWACVLVYGTGLAAGGRRPR